MPAAKEYPCIGNINARVSIHRRLEKPASKLIGVMYRQAAVRRRRFITQPGTRSASANAT